MEEKLEQIKENLKSLGLQNVLIEFVVNSRIGHTDENDVVFTITCNKNMSNDDLIPKSFKG